ncbi:carbohydrate kinase [Sphingobacterium alkalisoli]|nr:carbohydrate kinase [Sphingobacterium alkalisoli]
MSVNYPETEAEILSPEAGWAEQDPEVWWANTVRCIQKAHASNLYNPKEIKAIGIAYQMHGLVLVDRSQQVLRNAIIWCDSRAVAIGDKAFDDLGHKECLTTLLNSPGNFTASKLAWVKSNEPDIYEKIDKILLPGDFLTMKLTGELNTTSSALSEGVFWDFSTNALSDNVMSYFSFSGSFIPAINPVFSNHGRLHASIAAQLGLASDVVVTYKAGDQPNNALSLNVLKSGEVAATAGTSGVIYGVSNELVFDKQSRINTFAHVNHSSENVSTGVLLCINGTGIQNSWVKKMVGGNFGYDELNSIASTAPLGSGGLRILPFGNGAERMLNNRLVNAHIHQIDFNRHGIAEVLRATQEGIAFSFRYGLDIMRENGLNPSVIRAGNANLFLSPIFISSFVGATHTPVELYNNDGSVGAALGAGIGADIYHSSGEAFSKMQMIREIEPQQVDLYEELYQDWKSLLIKQLN